MQIKEIKPINFLFFRTETTISELEKFLPVAGQLFKEAVKQNLMITGPVHWHYHGFMGDVSKSFVLEIALPVANVINEYDGTFHFKRTEPFKCVTITHEGGWLEIPQSYAKLMQFMQEQKLSPSATNREVYVNVDMADPSANTTEIQMGIV